MAIITPVEIRRNGRILFSDFIDNYHSMRDQCAHVQLHNDLIKHQWDIKGHDEGDL